jgi:PAS domain S-box-containing protein
MDLIRKGSIKQKLMKVSMLTICVVLLLTSVMLIANELIDFRQSLIQRMAAMANTIGTNSTAALIFNDQKTAKETLYALKSAQNITCAVLYSRNGDVLAQYIRDVSAGDCRPHPVGPDGYHIGIDYLDILQHINLDNESIGTLYIQSDLKEIYHRIRWYLVTVFMVMMLSIATAFVLMSRLQEIITKPLSDMADVMHSISGEKDYSVRVAIQSQDEVGILGEGFNEMLSQIQKRDAEIELHRERLQNLVTQRTEELARTNIGLQQELAERKRAEEALRESEERFRTLSDKIPLGLSLIDIDGRYEYVNPAFLNIFGYDLSDIPTGREWLRTAYPDPEYSREVIAAWKEDMGSYQEFEVRPRVYEVRCKGGAVTTILFRSVSLPSGKQLVTYEDITDRKREEEEKRDLQERLNRAEKMESLGLLAGGVAHDLNNVLGIVVGYAELVLMKADESSSIRPHLVNIMNGGQKAAAIVDDLLTLARRGVSGKEVLNLNEIITDCQQSPEFEKLYSYHPAVKINSDLEPDQPNITCSSVHLGKSFYNLVSNACEAMPKGGMVTIKTTSQYLEQPLQGYDEVRGGEYVVLSVSDTGQGISANDLKRIFEPFYTKKVMGRSGTGLGLAVVWGTVKDHHGYINVESEEGKGSTFTLYFPVTREDITAEGVPASIAEYMGEGESILVVDDVKEQRDLAASILKALNYNVASVSSGEEAVAYLKENQADLMVLDMIMDPGMDGLDTYRSIIEIRPQQKAIIVSGFSESDRVHEAQGLGAGAYVKKPYIKEKLGMAVRKELDRK